MLRLTTTTILTRTTSTPAAIATRVIDRAKVAEVIGRTIRRIAVGRRTEIVEVPINTADARDNNLPLEQEIVPAAALEILAELVTVPAVAPEQATLEAQIVPVGAREREILGARIVLAAAREREARVVLAAVPAHLRARRAVAGLIVLAIVAFHPVDLAATAHLVVAVEARRGPRVRVGVTAWVAAALVAVGDVAAEGADAAAEGADVEEAAAVDDVNNQPEQQ